MKKKIGLIGLGVMGSALARNLMRSGNSLAMYSISEPECKKMQHFTSGGSIVCQNLKEMISQLQTPKTLFLMITAGTAVDEVLSELEPLIQPGDLIIDGGNSHYKDTDRRYLSLKEKGILYLGIGISGGESGALNGPSFMIGGSKDGYERTKEIWEQITAQHLGRACCTYFGEGGIGHYIKMVHNGIEYAIMQVIAEFYEICRHGLGEENETIADRFAGYQDSILNSYLIDSCIPILHKKEGSKYVLDTISDVASQKGTGLWTMQEALIQGIYVPTIYAAVSVRAVSVNQSLRMKRNQNWPISGQSRMEAEVMDEQLEETLKFAVLMCYLQGIILILSEQKKKEFPFDLSALLHTWEDGCIIRSRYLSEMVHMFESNDDFLFTQEYCKRLEISEKQCRHIVSQARKAGIVIPAMQSVLDFYEVSSNAQLPTNFVQALRDYFGAHGYQKTGSTEIVHTNWQESEDY